MWETCWIWLRSEKNDWENLTPWGASVHPLPLEALLDRRSRCAHNESQGAYRLGEQKLAHNCYLTFKIHCIRRKVNIWKNIGNYLRENPKTSRCSNRTQEHSSDYEYRFIITWWVWQELRFSTFSTNVLKSGPTKLLEWHAIFLDQAKC